MTVGQTIQVRRSGLNGIQLWLRKASIESKDSDVLTATLFHSLEDRQILATVPVAYSRFNRMFPVEIKFPPQEDPPNQEYFLLLQTQGGPVAIYGRSEDAYPEGSLYVDGIKQQADLGFRTSYNYGAAAIIADLFRGFRKSWLILPLFVLLWFPGRLVMEAALFFRPEKHTSLALDKPGVLFDRRVSLLDGRDWGERAALTVGLSCSILPVILLWTSALDLRITQTWVWAASGITIISCLGLWYLRRKRGCRLAPPDAIDLALIAIFLVTLWARLVMVRDLAAPAWVDPVHHATITRMIVEQGAYPRSYAPYVQVSTASYHSGYHALAAILHWLTQLDLEQAMLLLGQLMNGFSVVAVYALATFLSKDRMAGLFAAFICGFLTPMPAYYTSWGRYTQLAGLLILPVCAAFMIHLLEGWVFRPKDSGSADGSNYQADEQSADSTTHQMVYSLGNGFRLVILVGLTGAGLFMVHYRVAAFLGIFMAAYSVGELLRSLNKQPLWKTIPSGLFWVSAALILSILISLPWWPNLWQTLLQPRLSQTAPMPQSLRIDWGYLTPGFGESTLWLALLGLAIALLRARWFGPVLALWIGLLFIAANQGAIRIPGPGSINLSSVEIMLFMPIAVLGGYGISFFVDSASRILPVKIRRTFYVLLLTGLLVVAFLGMQKLIPILNPTTLLFREPDLHSMDWINANIPPEEIILINPFLWGYGIYAGHDGGYWITPLVGRQTFPPNLLYGLGERSDIQRINQISQKIIEAAGVPDQLFSLLEELEIRYIYLGRRGGVLSAQKLQENPHFKVLYQKDGTWLFQTR